MKNIGKSFACCFVRSLSALALSFSEFLLFTLCFFTFNEQPKVAQQNERKNLIKTKKKEENIENHSL